MKIEISGNTIQELKENLSHFADLILGPRTFPPDKVQPLYVESVPTKTDAVEGKRRGRPVGSVKKEEVTPEVSSEPVSPPPTGKPLTTADLTAAVQKVVDSKGVDAAQKLVLKFGYVRLREIPVEKYAEVIKACAELSG